MGRLSWQAISHSASPRAVLLQSMPAERAGGQLDGRKPGRGAIRAVEVRKRSFRTVYVCGPVPVCMAR